MAFHFSDLLSLVRSHPFVSGLLLLFFTPPFFPVVVYFSPLIVSTALCVLSLVSITAHFSASEGEDGTSDGVEASLTDEQIVRNVRVYKHESSWMEWIKGCDETMRHNRESQAAEDHELKLHSVKEEWSTSLGKKISSNAHSGERANNTEGEEKVRTAEVRNFASSAKEDLSHVKEREEDAGEEEHHTRTALRFSFFEKERKAYVLPSSDGCTSTANVFEKNLIMNPPAAVEESTKPCHLQQAEPYVEDGKVSAPDPAAEHSRSEVPEE